MKYNISIVIPTFNRCESLKKCLSAIEKQTMSKNNFEVIIINDGSSDKTENFLESFTSQTELNFQSFLQANKGPAAARNLGINKAQGEFIAFTDDDCIPAKNWLEELLNAFPNDKKYAGVGGWIQRCSNDPLTHFFDHVGALHHNINRCLVTANALFRSAALYTVDGFNEGFTFAGGEDVDLSCRIIKKGYKFKVCRHAIVHHQHRSALFELIKTFFSYGSAGQLLVVYSNQNKNKNFYFLRATKKYTIKVFRDPDLNLIRKIIFPIIGFFCFCSFDLGYFWQKRHLLEK